MVTDLKEDPAWTARCNACGWLKDAGLTFDEAGSACESHATETNHDDVTVSHPSGGTHQV
jgi:hypothetical protein